MPQKGITKQPVAELVGVALGEAPGEGEALGDTPGVGEGVGVCEGLGGGQVMVRSRLPCVPPNSARTSAPLALRATPQTLGSPARSAAPSDAVVLPLPANVATAPVALLTTRTR